MASRKKTEGVRPTLTPEQWEGVSASHELVGFAVSELIKRAKDGNRTANSILQVADVKFKVAKRIEAFKRLADG